MQIGLKIPKLSSKLYAFSKILSKILDFLNYLIFNCSIPATARIGNRTKLSKGGIAIIIHERAVIG